MAYVPSPQQVERMIRQAMQENAPEMFASLSQAGKLDQAIQQRVQMFEEMTNEATSRAIMSRAMESALGTPEEKVRNADQEIRLAVEVALALATEF